MSLSVWSVFWYLVTVNPASGPYTVPAMCLDSCRTMIVRVVDMEGQSCLPVQSRLVKIGEHDTFTDVFDRLVPDLDIGKDFCLRSVQMKCSVDSPNTSGTDTQDLDEKVSRIVQLVTDMLAVSPSVITFLVSPRSCFIISAGKYQSTPSDAVSGSSRRLVSPPCHAIVTQAQHMYFITRQDIATWFPDDHRATAAAKLAEFLAVNGCGFNRTDPLEEMFKAVAMTFFSVTPDLKRAILHDCTTEHHDIELLETLVNAVTLIGQPRPAQDMCQPFSDAVASVVDNICDILSKKSFLRFVL